MAKPKWYRGENCNFYPKKKGFTVDRILHGTTPKRPFIEKDSHIVTIGSCFAQRVTEYLNSKGYTSVTPEKNNAEFISAGTNTTFAMRQLFEWIFLNKEPVVETWHKENQAILKRTPRRREKVLNYFCKADVIIMTLGLSEVWVDKKSQGVFWRSVPEDVYKEGRHIFRVSTVEENKENIEVILQLVKKFVPEVKVIVTLSPVPLKATFRPISCVVANSVSKAILRAAIDETLRQDWGDWLYYFPSYEIATQFVDNPYQDDNRHIVDQTVNLIMKTFSKYYLVKPQT